MSSRPLKSGSAYHNAGVKLPTTGKTQKISELLSRFEPLPDESAIQTNHESKLDSKRRSFTSTEAKSKRNSLNLSGWRAQISIEDLQRNFESPSSSANHHTSSTDEPKAKFERSTTGPPIAERKKFLLSGHRSTGEVRAPDSPMPTESPPVSGISQVRALVANLEKNAGSTGTQQGHHAQLQRQRSRSRRASSRDGTSSRSGSALSVFDLINQPLVVGGTSQDSNDSEKPVNELLRQPSPLSLSAVAAATSTDDSAELEKQEVTNDKKENVFIHEEHSNHQENIPESSSQLQTTVEQETEVKKPVQITQQEIEENQQENHEEKIHIKSEEPPKYTDNDSIDEESEEEHSEEELSESESPPKQQQQQYSPIITRKSEPHAPGSPTVPTTPGGKTKTKSSTKNKEEGAIHDLVEETNDEDTVLDLKGCLALLDTDSPVTAIELMNQGLDDDAIDTLFAKLEETGKINGVERISLNGNDFEEIGAERIVAALLTNSSVTSLDIAWNLIGSAGAAHLANLLKVTTTLKMLNIDGNDLGQEGARALAAGLQHNTSLTHLEMKDNGVGDRGAAAIAFSLQKHPSLTVLDLTCNTITANGVEQLVRYLIGNPDVSDNELDEHKLETLILNSNMLDDDGAYIIADALSVSRNLKSLQMRSCGLGVDGIQAICEALIDREDPRLTELDLNLNTNTVESEIMMNDLLMSNEDLYVEWKDAQSACAWDQEDVQVIIKHYGFSEILANLLNGFSLAPLIDNQTLLSALEITDDHAAVSFVSEAIKTVSGLEMISTMIRRGLPAAEADDFDEYEGEDLYLDENDDELSELSCLVRAVYTQLDYLVGQLTIDEPATSTSSGNIQLFGAKRLAIVELIIALMDEEGSVIVNQRLVKLGVPKIFLEFLPRFPRNNILHKQVQLFVRVCLRTESLRNCLLSTFHILDFLLLHSEREWTKPVGKRESFSGYLALILDDIMRFDFDEVVGTQLEEHEQFNEFLETTYVTYKNEGKFSILPPTEE